MAKTESPPKGAKRGPDIEGVFPDPPVDETGSPARTIPNKEYQDLTPEPIILPPREPDGGYVRPPMTDQTFVPEVY